MSTRMQPRRDINHGCTIKCRVPTQLGNIRVFAGRNSNFRRKRNPTHGSSSKVKDGSVLRKNLPPRNSRYGVASSPFKNRERANTSFHLEAPTDAISPSNRATYRRPLRRAGDLRRVENDAIYGKHADVVARFRVHVHRSVAREKVAVCQNLGLDMGETPGVARNPAGSHDFAADCHCTFRDGRA